MLLTSALALQILLCCCIVDAEEVAPTTTTTSSFSTVAAAGKVAKQLSASIDKNSSPTLCLPYTIDAEYHCKAPYRSITARVLWEKRGLYRTSSEVTRWLFWRTTFWTHNCCHARTSFVWVDGGGTGLAGIDSIWFDRTNLAQAQEISTSCCHQQTGKSKASCFILKLPIGCWVCST